MKYILRSSIVLLLIAVLVFSFVSHVSADTFNQNRIIDDSVFDNTNSMSAGQIDAWLNNNFPSSCISTRNGFSSPDPIGYNPSQGYLYGGNVSGGQVISDAAQAYGINPQVLIATLQKESSVVSGDASYHCQYINTSMGYGCPDSGSCPTNPATMSGFSKQVIHAAWLLKFGEQRSEGNTGWAVIRGNWNNSDDPPTCYGGPMTTGTLSRGCGQAATYFDGNTTIDGTAVHMDTGATATLYWYTPHFSGNQHFFSIFTGWFGSTTGTPLVEGSNGIVYLVNGSTRYGVPSGEMLSNYGIAGLRITPVSDAYIQSLTDGGTLSTLFTVSGDPTVYVADRGTKYGIPSAAYCTAWGLDCANSVRQISAGDANRLYPGGTLQPLMQFSGTIYKMQAGLRYPYLSQAAVAADGYNAATQVSNIGSGYNTGSGVGTPIIESNALVQFGSNPTVYFYANNKYYGIPDGTTYTDWFASRGIYHDNISQYAASPPTTSGNLSILFKTAANKTYLLDSERKIDVTSNASNWPAAFSDSGLDAIVSGYPLAATENTTNTYRTPNGAIYTVKNGQKQVVASMDDFYELGYSLNNCINVRTETMSLIPTGLFSVGEGSVFKVSGSTAIYLKGPGQSLYYLLSQDQLGQFQLTRQDPVLPVGQLSLYNTPQPLSSFVGLDGSTSAQDVVDADANLWTFGSTQAGQWGIVSPALTNITSNSSTMNGLYKPSRTLPQFALYNGTVYYGSGGVKHPIATQASYKQLGGNASNTFNATKDFIDAAPTGSIL